MFEGAPILLINHTGARTGKSRTNPVMYLKDGHRYLVFASKGGADTNPDWYHNLLANPKTTIEVGTETASVTASLAEGEERQRLWEAQKAAMPAFEDYEHKTSRPIPVIILDPTG